MAGGSPEVLWQPSADRIARANATAFARYVGRRIGRDVTAYDDLWQWSVSDLPGFWAAVWDHYDLGQVSDFEQVLAQDAMPGAEWFPGAKLNFAGYLLSRGEGETAAIVGSDESGARRIISWDELRRQVLALAGTLRALGVQRGDRVVGYLPNVPEAVIAFLATALIGAVWSAVGEDYAPGAAVDRFGQLQPKLLFAADGYRFKGRPHDRRAEVEQVRSGLASVEHMILVETIGSGSLPGSLSWAEALTRHHDQVIEPEQVPFDHPLWVLFSSGTTGIPKGLVHGHGGMLLESLKTHSLQLDLGAGDRMFWYTSPSWAMWNIQLGAMVVGASIVCHDGSPLHPDAGGLWSLVSELGVSFFGMSPGYLRASMLDGVHPSADNDLTALRTMGSTGSPLTVDVHRWAAREVPGVPVFSTSGGTDVSGAFCGGVPTVPVWAGEISARCLGVAMEAWDEDGRAVVDDVGELVVTRPMPSMPVCLWNDPNGERYRNAYFDTFPGVWRHGDWITLTSRGSVIVHGRSDSTLNRHGVRMGSADIYAAVDRVPEVIESLVIGAEQPDGSYWMPLFVVLAEGQHLHDGLVARINDEIRQRASARHVPDEVIAVRGIPHTRTGKKLEVPIKRILQGAQIGAVANADSIDDPSLLETFAGVWTQRQASLQQPASGRERPLRPT